jgi:hypothetical protein
MSERDNTGRGADEDRSRHQGRGRDDEGFGDDGGTRIGRPDGRRREAAPGSVTGVKKGEEGSTVEDEPSRREVDGSDRAKSGAGAEAAEGIHGSQGKQPLERSDAERAHGEPGRGEGAGLSGSEPLRHREGEHKSGYGGEMGEPKTSSDQR